MMRKQLWACLFVLALVTLTACGGDGQTGEEEDELFALDVELDVPEAVEVDETVEMKALVTYGDEKVTDADEVVFEVWEEGKKDASEMIPADNHEDGTYTAETSFGHDGVFTVQVHVTAKDMHTMPKQSVTVGEGGDYDVSEDGHEHVEGFEMHFTSPDDAEAGSETALIVHIQMDEEPFEGLDVRYEIWSEEAPEKREWLDAEESAPGEYKAAHTFAKAGTYRVQIHVEDDDGLHEHEEHEVAVAE